MTKKQICHERDQGESYEKSRCQRWKKEPADLLTPSHNLPVQLFRSGSPEKSLFPPQKRGPKGGPLSVVRCAMVFDLSSDEDE
jgi:hypothetical protein